MKVVPSLWYSLGSNSTFPKNPESLYWVQGEAWWIAVGVATGLFEGTYRVLFGIYHVETFIVHLQRRSIGLVEGFHVFVLS